MRESFGFLDGMSERMELGDAGDASLDMAGDAVSSPGCCYHSGPLVDAWERKVWAIIFDC